MHLFLKLPIINNNHTHYGPMQQSTQTWLNMGNNRKYV